MIAGEEFIGEQALGGSLTRWRSFKDKTPTGVLGDARVASAEKGERLLDTAARLLADQGAAPLHQGAAA